MDLRFLRKNKKGIIQLPDEIWYVSFEGNKYITDPEDKARVLFNSEEFISSGYVNFATYIEPVRKMTKEDIYNKVLFYLGKYMYYPYTDRRAMSNILNVFVEYMARKEGVIKEGNEYDNEKLKKLVKDFREYLEYIKRHSIGTFDLKYLNLGVFLTMLSRPNRGYDLNKFYELMIYIFDSNDWLRRTLKGAEREELRGYHNHKRDIEIFFNKGRGHDFYRLIRNKEGTTTENMLKYVLFRNSKYFLTELTMLLQYNMLKAHGIPNNYTYYEQKYGEIIYDV